ncbi:glycoside hydrolase [Wenyingzhuangia sp. 1_MG-2023]|nr:glycoside hydrolase [Wenyingzhuangia sp. 1_MG-2023]
MIKLRSFLMLLIAFVSCTHNNDDNVYIPPAVESKEEILTSTKDKPTFINGEDPKPDNKIWKKVDLLSDEFEENTLDSNKWALLISSWAGRPPALFTEEAVTLSNGNLNITNYLLNTSQVVNGNTYTHAGSLVRSIHNGSPGMYFECRMKANKTFMSSTFWLINDRNSNSGCDRRTTELDIQECVGEITTDATWAQKMNHGMNSNTHSRNTSCDETNIGSKGGEVETDENWKDYHIYAAWWKNETEILFFLDGKHQFTVNPIEKFNLPMSLRMVTETYDWNPEPTDGGMTGNWEDRTTKYDWVRTWQLAEIIE